MSTVIKVVAVMVLMMLVLVVGSGLLLAAAVARAGLMTVEVHSSGPEGDVDLTVPVPAVLVPLAVLGARLAPDVACDLDGVRCRLADWTPAAAAALRELAAAPDAVLVDVRDHGDSVQIVKRGDRLEIEVDDGRDRVEVTMPVELLPALAEALD